MTRATSIRIHKMSTQSREYDCITLVISDLHLHADLTDDRQIRLAKRLADSHRATFYVTPELQGRVNAALKQEPS